MKNRTLIALLEADELPMELLRNWIARTNGTPIDDAKQEIRKQESYSRIGWGLLGIAVIAMISVFLVMSEHKWTAEIPSAVYSNLLSFFLILCVLNFGAAVVLITLTTSDSSSEFGTQLEKLREIIGLTYGEMRVWTLEDLRTCAENTLRTQAEYVKTIQGPNGENSLSNVAKKARAKYEEFHKTLFAFGLCEEKWDRYWKVPEPENKKGEVVSDAA